jgi:hypothetical protein
MNKLASYWPARYIEIQEVAMGLILRDTRQFSSLMP